MNKCVYQHIRLDTNEIFYIGIGDLKRSNSINYRNKYWHNIVNKHGYKIEILYTNLNWEEACNIEKELISHHGRKDLGTGLLVNMTNGGEGSFGTIVSNETRQKLSKIRKGKKQSKIWIENRANSLKGRTLSNNHKLKLSLAKKNKPSNQCRKIIDITTNTIFNSIKEAAKFIDMKRTTLNAKLSGQSPNNTNLKYIEQWLQ